MNRISFATVLLCTWIYCANSVKGEEFSWHGYLSQGITQSINSQFITDDESITLELTEIGFNGHYQLSSNVSVAGQVVYLDGGNRFERGSRIDYLFLDWELPEYAGWQSYVHIGRFKNRHWLYSPTRDVPQTRDTAVLPQSIYADGFRDIALGSDGIHAGFTRYTNAHIWEVNWSYGRSHINKAQTEYLLGTDAKGRAKQDFVHQASVFLQPSAMNWKLGASWLSSDFSYEPAELDYRFAGGAEFLRMMVSALYFAESWEFSAELLREIQDSKGLFTPTFREKRRGEGGFVQFRYRFTSEFSGSIGYDTYTHDVSDKDGNRLFITSGGTVPAYFGYMDAVVLGARWDIAPNWRLQAEHHWVDGGSRAVSLLDRNIASHTEEHWRMWSVQLMYWF